MDYVGSIRVSVKTVLINFRSGSPISVCVHTIFWLKHLKEEECTTLFQRLLQPTAIRLRQQTFLSNTQSWHPPQRLQTSNRILSAFSGINVDVSKSQDSAKLFGQIGQVYRQNPLVICGNEIKGFPISSRNITEQNLHFAKDPTQ